MGYGVPNGGATTRAGREIQGAGGRRASNSGDSDTRSKKGSAIPVAAKAALAQMGIPAAKFNDDRLARTLDAIQPHCGEIWQEVGRRALIQAQVELDLILYDFGFHHPRNIHWQ